MTEKIWITFITTTISMSQQSLMKVIVNSRNGVYDYRSLEIKGASTPYVEYLKERYYIVTGEKGVDATCKKLMEGNIAVARSHTAVGYVIQSSNDEWWLMMDTDVEARASATKEAVEAAHPPPPPSSQSSSGLTPCSIGCGGGGAPDIPPTPAVEATATVAVDSMDLTEATVDSPFRIDDATLGRYDGKTYFKVTVGLKEPDATKPRDVEPPTKVFVVDISGSMGLWSTESPEDGTRIQQQTDALDYILENTENGIRVVIITYSTLVQHLFDDVMDDTTRELAKEKVKKLRPMERTNLRGALESAIEHMELIGKDKKFDLVVTTDGEADQKKEELFSVCKGFRRFPDLSMTTVSVSADCPEGVLNTTCGLPFYAVEDPNRRHFYFVGNGTKPLIVQLAEHFAVQEGNTQPVHIKVSFPPGVTAKAMEGEWKNTGQDNTFEQTGKVSTMFEIKALFHLSLPDGVLHRESIIEVEALVPGDNSLSLPREIPLDEKLTDTDYNVGVMIENLHLKTLVRNKDTSRQTYNEQFARLRKIPEGKLDDWSKSQWTRLSEHVAQILAKLGTEEQGHILAAASSDYKAGSTYRSSVAQKSAKEAISSGYSYKGHGGGGGSSSSSSSSSMDVGPGSMSHKPTSHRRRLKLSQTLWSDRGGAGGGGGGGGGGDGYRS